jgi:RNA recognition motif-containing protein
LCVRIIKKNKERIKKEKNDKKVEVKQSSNSNNQSTLTSFQKQSISISERKHLHNYRVIQRNLVYIIGLPNSLASEELLKKPEYFGQYGKITKMVIHKNGAQSTTTTTHSTNGLSISSYVTFQYKEDAKAAIQALEGFWIESHLIRASFGTTKYCNNFIRGKQF